VTQRRTIAHAELMQLPVLQYDGPIHLLKTPAELARALHHIRRERVVGLDTETPPTFKKGQSHPPALVQIATAHAVYLFPLARLDCSAALAAILSDPAIAKAGIAIGRDLLELRRLFPFHAANVTDLGQIARRHGIKQTGARNLAGLFLGGRILKSARTSNWARPRLSEKQLRYAATDAWVCRQLYLHFQQLGMLPAATATATPPP
jgi:ribonuclease D